MGVRASTPAGLNAERGVPAPRPRRGPERGGHMTTRTWSHGVVPCTLALLLAACGGGGSGTDTPPPPSNDVELSAQERATLVAALLEAETRSIDSGRAQAARAARGAALAIQGGTRMTGVTLTGSAAPLVGARRTSLAGAVWAAGYQVDILNMAGHPAPVRLYGALARLAGGALVLTGGESTSSAIPPTFGVLFTSPAQVWLATAGQASSEPVADGGACPIGFSISGVSCTLATFRAAFDVTTSAPAPFAGNTATGSQTATLAAGQDLRGVKLSVDCAQAGELVNALFCRWVPEPRLTVVVNGTIAGSITPTPGGVACPSTPGPCAWSYATGTSVQLRASPVGPAFFDGDFQDDAWTLQVLTDGLPGGTATAARQPTGGNPGASRRVTLTIPAAPGDLLTSSVGAFSWKTGATYDPRVGGAITSVDWSQDHRAAPGAQFLSLAIEQDGKLYLPSTRYADSQTWTRFAEAGLVSDGFDHVTPPDLVPVQAGGPDFTARGSTMTFGFFRNASTGYGGGGYTTVADTDGWSVTLHTDGASARSPTWSNCHDVNADGVCFVNLADDRTVNLTFE